MSLLKSDIHDLTGYASDRSFKYCKDCGAAIQGNGYWYLSGYRSKEEPPCEPYKIDFVWKNKAERLHFPDVTNWGAEKLNRSDQ